MPPNSKKEMTNKYKNSFTASKNVLLDASSKLPFAQFKDSREVFVVSKIDLLFSTVFNSHLLGVTVINYIIRGIE